MITIDGSQGEGGGQILRTALSLSMCMGKSVRIEKIREKRPKPGLRNQHLTCVRAAQAICDAKVTGDEVGSDCVVFEPGAIKSGVYDFAIGTAGSTTLVFQTVLPALLLGSNRSVIRLEGGTHNPKAPSFDFIDQVFLPAIRRMGVTIDASIESYGFIPKGGGRWEVSLEPVVEWEATKILTSQGKPRLDVRVILANLDEKIAERELKVVERLLPHGIETVSVDQVPSLSEGNVVSIRQRSKGVSELIEVLGEKRLPAEKVARRAVDQYRRFTATDAPVGEYLADQLLLMMALGKGGRFITAKPSLHTRTNMDVIEKITGKCFSIRPVKGQTVEIAMVC